MNQIVIPIILILFVGSIPLGFSEPLKEQLYNEDVKLSGLSCDNENHVLALRSNGEPACVTEKNGIKAGWKLLYDNSVYVNNDGTLQCYTWEIPLESRARPFISVEAQCDLLYNDTSIIKCTDAFYERYELVEPSSVTVSDGEFLHLCVERDFKWFKIHVDAKAGSTTITIPKGIVDLKQFDYPVCNSEFDFFAENSNGDKVPVIVKQISNTDNSRTLQFTYSDDVSVIYNFGVFGDIFYRDGVLVEPNHCIDLVESGYRDANPVVKKEKTTQEVFDDICRYHDIKSYDDMAKLFNIPNNSVEYSITGGELLGVAYNEDSWGVFVVFIDAVETGMLVITVPDSLVGELTKSGVFVLINGEEAPMYDLVSSSTGTTFTIQFPSCSQEIEIITSMY